MRKIIGFLPFSGTFFALSGSFSDVSSAQESSLTAPSGKKYFTRCTACHSPSSSSRPLTGPHLENIVGRQAASVRGFSYAPRLRSQNFVWDKVRLDRWLTKPQADFPGMCLPFRGFPRAEDRAALIAYLKNPAP